MRRIIFWKGMHGKYIIFIRIFLAIMHNIPRIVSHKWQLLLPWIIMLSSWIVNNFNDICILYIISSQNHLIQVLEFEKFINHESIVFPHKTIRMQFLIWLQLRSEKCGINLTSSDSNNLFLTPIIILGPISQELLMGE